MRNQHLFLIKIAINVIDTDATVQRNLSNAKVVCSVFMLLLRLKYTQALCCQVSTMANPTVIIKAI